MSSVGVIKAGKLIISLREIDGVLVLEEVREEQCVLCSPVFMHGGIIRPSPSVCVCVQKVWPLRSSDSP